MRQSRDAVGFDVRRVIEIGEPTKEVHSKSRDFEGG